MRLFLILCCTLLAFWQCEPRDEVLTSDPSAKLEFSTDSVLFDTIFTEIRNITKRLKVYNRNNRAVKVDFIRLNLGASSNYQITVNGLSNDDNFFPNLEIRGGDSIYILVNIRVDGGTSQNMPFLVEDEIAFQTNGNAQQIYLRSWGQDAVFYTDFDSVSGVLNIDRPIVIINSIIVPSGETLTINAGTRIYLDYRSSILVFGTLEILGNTSSPVVLKGIRQEEEFKNAPAQWGNEFTNAIWFFDGSNANIIEWAEIWNATTAIRLGNVYDVDRPDLQLKNTIIKNMGIDGLLSFGGNLTAHNNLITNCGGSGMALFLGGSAELFHNTIASYGFDFNREDPGMIITDFFPDSTGSGLEVIPFSLFDMRNNIVWGNLEDEWLFNFQLAPGSNNFIVQNNALRVNNQEIRDQLSTGTGNLVFQEQSDIRFIDYQAYDFQLDTLSPAKDVGFNLSLSPNIDLNGNARTDGLPDIGAYERQN